MTEGYRGYGESSEESAPQGGSGVRNPEMYARVAQERREKIDKALDIAFAYAMFDGDSHKMWTIDQMVRVLMGPEGYESLMRREGEKWDQGIAP